MAKKLSRKEVIDKINTFLNVTVERGASENEAMMAAKHAASLLAEYDLTFYDLTGEAEIRGKADVFVFRKELSRHMFGIAKAIGELCAVEVLISGHGNGEMHIIGSPIDVDFGRYLCAICLRAIESEAKAADRRYALFRSNVRYRNTQSVLQGMSQRLNERILELAWARRARTTNAIVVAKEDIVEETKLRLGIKTNPIKLRNRDVDPEAFKSGVELANKVTLNNAIQARDQDHTAFPYEVDGNEDEKEEDDGIMLIGQS